MLTAGCTHTPQGVRPRATRMDDAGYRELSFWHDSHPGSLAPRPALDSERQVDVAIVGAGYTGLWTAYYLKALEPGIRVAIAESEIAGFGASGRNGGWCVGLLAGIESLAADPTRREGVIRLQRAVFDAVSEVGRVSDAEGIDCHYARGGSVSFASVAPHLQLVRCSILQLLSCACSDALLSCAAQVHCSGALLRMLLSGTP